MDDLLPWDMPEDAPAAPTQAAHFSESSESSAAVEVPHMDEDAGLDWLGDLAGPSSSKPEPAVRAAIPVEMDDDEEEPPTQETDVVEEDALGVTEPSSVRPHDNHKLSAPLHAEASEAAAAPYPSEPAVAAVARTIQAALDADVTTTSSLPEDASTTHEIAAAGDVTAGDATAGAVAEATLDAAPMPRRTESVAPTTTAATHLPRTSPLRKSVSPTSTPASSITAATTTKKASITTTARGRTRASGQASVTGSSRQTSRRHSKASEPVREILTAVVREPSEVLVSGTGMPRSRVASRQSRSSGKFESHKRTDATASTRSKSGTGAGGPRTTTAATLGNPSVTRENFFFAGDDMGVEFGLGTTGLYASKVAPVTAADKSRTAPARSFAGTSGAAAAAAAGPSGTMRSSRAVARGQPAQPMSGSPDEPAGLAATVPGTASARAYFTSAFYTKVPEGHHGNAWARKEEAFEEWRTTQLRHSTYYTYGKSAATRTDHTADPSGAPGKADGAEAEPWLDPVSFYTDEEAQAFERRRTAAIAAERRAKVKARESETDQREADLSTQHREYQRGVPTYLPDAYYRTTLAQEEVTQLPGNHLTCSDPRAVIGPHDHHRAQVAYRHYQSQVAEDQVALRQRDAKKYHARIERDISQSRKELEAFQQTWLEGLPHLSRADALAKSQSAEDTHRARARLNAEEVKFNRSIYALYRDDDEAARREHLSQLRTKLPVASQERLLALREKSAREASAAATARPSSQAMNASGSKPTHTPAPPPTKKTSSPSPPPVPAATTTVAPSASAAPALVPIVMPARSFVAEVQQWQDTFQTPNVTPVTAQDPQVRREWLRRLSGERRHFKKDTVEMGKAQPVRVQQALVDLQDERVKTADGQRKENASLKERRLEVEAENHAYATALYDQNKDVLAKGRDAREEMVAARQLSALAQRHREREIDAMMNTLEQEELRRLKEAVTSTRS